MAEFVFENKDLTPLKGNVIVVTGGSSGIGLATVELLLSIGASVVNGDVQAPEKEMAGAYEFIKTDVTKWEELLVLFNKAKEIHGRIDHVFANSGIGPRADYLSTQLDQAGNLMEPSSQNLDINLKGVINTSTLAIHHLRQQAEGGSIVITKSATVARCAVYLMADTTMNGQVVHVQRGKYAEVDTAVLIPAYRKIKGDDYPSEDEVFERLAAAAA
ncbi:hypothetical protein FOMG_19015 [Fusarium oxysporum f. sp. melonis 26406]|uniref:Uncharacterized protein n=1 Tax=Fusarium oxysporum f. sp. melonis 26406 TaxID=1089452 RepID=W9YXG4_FUSOX|nr:hypothetical protein FOMG_19015 [Fusarium oxysporum f. sp. melonis 26406]